MNQIQEIILLLLDIDRIKDFVRRDRYDLEEWVEIEGLVLLRKGRKYYYKINGSVYDFRNKEENK